LKQKTKDQMRAKKTIAMLLLAYPLLLLGGTKHAASEYLDEHTGATVTVADTPLIFALKQSILAANSRDYVSLTAAEVDRSGQPSIYLIGYIWSTIDRRGPAKDLRKPRKYLELLADARPIALKADADYPADLTDDERLSSPGKKYLARLAFRVTIEELRFAAESRSLLVRMRDESAEEGDDADVYTLWQDGRESLRAFVGLIGPG
jgi:hypothetical protein